VLKDNFEGLVVAYDSQA